MAKSRSQLPHLHYPSDMQQVRIINPHAFPGGGIAFGNASRDFEQTSGHYINMGTGLNSLLTAGAITMAAWVKAESFPSGYHMVLGCHTAGGYCLFYIKSNGKLALYNSEGSGFYDGSGSGTVGVGVWHHVTMGIGGGNLIGYIDGAEDDTVSGTFTTPTGAWRIGLDNSGTSPFWDGLISDVRVYDRLLSAGEVASLAAGTHITSGLVGWWPFQNDDVLDYSGNGNHGTNNGSTYSTDGPLN